MIKTTVIVDGMMCGMCESHVNDAVRKVFQVDKVTSSHSKGETVIISEKPVDDTHKFTLYMIGAATVSLLYPGTMFILGLRNSYLYDKLNKFAKEKSETETVKSTQISKPSVSGYTVSDMKTLVSALISDKKLTEEEKEFLLEYIKKK